MSSYRREQWTMITASLMVLAAVAIGFVLWFTRSVMIPFVLAVFVAAVVVPLADWLEVRARFRRWMSVIAVLLLVLVVTAFALLLLTYTAYEVGQSVDRYTRVLIAMVSESLEKSGDAVEKAAEGVEARGEAGEQPGEQPPAEVALEPREPAGVEGVVGDPQAEIPPRDDAPFFNAARIRTWLTSLEAQLNTYLTTIAQNVLGTAARLLQTIFTTFALMTIFLLFLLAARDPERLKHGVYADIETQIRSYLSIKLASSALTGVLVTLILGFMKVELALVFGVLTFLLNFIPSIGSIIATLLPLPLASAQYILEPLQADEAIRPWMVVAVLLGPGVVQLVIGNILEPRIMGEGLQLHPIVILIALAFWTLLWGPIGAILAVPITAVIRIATSQFGSLQVVTDALAGRLPE